MPEQFEWNWYGTWVLDWLCENEPYTGCDIWMRGFFEEYPELEDAYLHCEIDFLEVFDYYGSATLPVVQAPIFQPFFALSAFWYQVARKLRLPQLRWWLMDGAHEIVEPY